MLDRCSRHLQVRRRRQYLLLRTVLPCHLVISQEKFFSRQSRAVALLAQVRRVPVHQRMQHRLPFPVPLSTSHSGFDPVMLPRKRIRRQTHPSRLSLPIHPLPFHLHSPYSPFPLPFLPVSCRSASLLNSLIPSSLLFLPCPQYTPSTSCFPATYSASFSSSFPTAITTTH